MDFKNIPASMYRDSTPPDLTDEQEKLKLDLYNKIAPRRRTFIDRIGYDNWDPFQKPNDPLEIRRDVSKRTTKELVRDFFHSRPKDENQSNAYRQAALEFALGVISRDEKFLGYFDFAMWYFELLQKEGLMEKANLSEMPDSQSPDSQAQEAEKNNEDGKANKLFTRLEN